MLSSTSIEASRILRFSIQLAARSLSSRNDVEQVYVPTESRLPKLKHTPPDLSFSGGRSSASGLSVTVFGNSGFTGRAVVNRLGKIGSSITLPYRGEPSNLRHLRVLGDLGQIAIVPCDVYRPDEVKDVIGHSNLVINLIGRNYSTANFSCEQTNLIAAENIAKACAEVGVDRLIHVSALGVSTSSHSEWARSKALGEQAVRKHFPKATILRPAQIYGISDNFIIKLANMVRFHYAFPYMAPGRRIQPLFIGDFASALMSAVRDADTAGQTYELAGPETFTHREIVELISQHTQISLAHGFNLPDPLVRLITRFWYRRFRSPAFSVEELDWYKDGDALVSKNALTIQDLGVAPSSLHDHIASLTVLYQRPKERYLV